MNTAIIHELQSLKIEKQFSPFHRGLYPLHWIQIAESKSPQKHYKQTPTKILLQ
ncbi:hypothetical protein HMI55_003482 [Coelomomyces lativittatus]|nr:hypothetical protein HMI55_003482 [Coelomomyces lativittatus]